MSTRVQKGGTVFKPVVKARPRPTTDASRATSAGTEVQAARTSERNATSLANGIASSDTPLPASETSASYQPGQTTGPPNCHDDALPSRTNTSTGASFSPSVQAIAAPSQPSIPPQHGSSQATLSSLISSAARNVGVPLVTNSHATPSLATSIAPPGSGSIQRPPTSGGRDSIDGSQPHSLGQTPTHSSTTTTIQPQLDNLNTQQPTPSLPNDAGSLQFDFSAVVSEGARTGVVGGEGSDPPLTTNGDGTVEQPSQPSTALGTALADESVHPRRSSRKKSVPTSEDTVAGSSAEGTVRRRKRIRRATSEPEESEGSDTVRKRSRKTPKAGRKSRASSVATFDPDADPGEDLDPTVVTMAMLCDDTGQGRVSSKAAQILSNHAAWKKSNRERRARMRALMEAKKYGRDEDDVEGATSPNGTSSQLAGPSSSAHAASSSTPIPSEVENPSEPADGAEKDGFDYSQSIATSRFNVQVRIGPNGETIVDEESLFVDRAEEQDTENYTHVEESDATKFVNSATYGKKFRGSRWSAEETELFFDALSQFGENYELISYVLPGRDRKSCKNKFKIEDKKNPNRINYCLNNRIPYDIQTLTRLTGKDFSGPTPIIRAKTPPNMAQLDASAAAAGLSPSAVRKQSQTPGLDVGTDGGLSETEGASAGQKGRHSSRKAHSRKKKDDGVEVLGTIDGGEWD